jgi:hypothetical protein
MIYGIQASKDIKLSINSRALKEDAPLIKRRTDFASIRNITVLIHAIACFTSIYMGLFLKVK